MPPIVVTQQFQINKDKAFPPNWLITGNKQIKLEDGNLTLTQLPASYGANLDAITIRRVQCGDISNTFPLPPHAVIVTDYSVYHPSTVTIICETGFTADPVDLKCDSDGKWKWDIRGIEGTTNIDKVSAVIPKIECRKVQCGAIDQSWFALYDANVYWQEYSYYNATAIVYCNAKEVRHVGELVCQDSGEWKWKRGFMPFQCPSFSINKNSKGSMMAKYGRWILAGCLMFVAVMIFVGMNLSPHLINKYRDKFA